MAAERKRTSYTAAFKLLVVEKAEESGNREAGRLFCVNEKNVRLWRKAKDSLSKTDKNRRSNRRGRPYWPQLDQHLLQWLLEQRDSRAIISVTDILAKARMLSSDLELKDFGCNRGWCDRFLKRMNLKILNGMIFNESLPADWETKAQTFYQVVEESVKKLNCGHQDIAVLEEVSITFDPSKEATASAVGEAASSGKFNFKVIISCSADGSKLKPLIIFRTRDNPFGIDFPDGIEVEANDRGCLDADVMTEWFNIVWKTRRGNSSPSGVLIIDSTKAHILSESKRICEDISAEVLVIPEGMKSKLQPADFGITKYFEAVVKFLWKKHTSGDLSSSSSDQSSDSNLAEIAEWVKKAWSRISSGKIRRSFIDSGLVKAQTGTEVVTAEGESSSVEMYVEEMFVSESDDDFDCDIDV